LGLYHALEYRSPASDTQQKALDDLVFKLPTYQLIQLPTLKMLRILYIAYPLLTVSDASAGGAEQVLWTLEREMARRGVQTTVAASAGSRVAGELFITGKPCAAIDDFKRRDHEHQEKILEFVRRRAEQGRGFDLVHDMSGSFWTQAARVNAPGIVMATLHLPCGFYAPQSFQNVPPNASFNCVSHSQAQSFGDLPNLLGVAPNGISLDQFRAGFNAQTNGGPQQRQGLLWLGRICEEKAPHLALDIAERVGAAITVAGQVYPFSYHQQYFEREVAPRLKRLSGAKFVSTPPMQQKLELLSHAQALLITSQVDETSSLVAMEAAASGTPVIAFRRGALAEVVRHGVTGFVVESLEQAVEACGRMREISGEACIAYAQENFSSARMADGYQALYSRVLSACGASAA
jgi:glycosyltransferase involved in cell wall biosynthesis